MQGSLAQGWLWIQLALQVPAGCWLPRALVRPPSTLTVGVGSVLPSSGFFMLFQILLKCLLMQIFKFALSRVAGSLYWSSGLHSVL